MAAFRVILRGVFWLLLVYWLIFIGYTVKNLVAGGSGAAVIWYRHISGGAVKWDWRVFLLQQGVILAVTLASWFFGRRPVARSVGHG
jgi:hypothetical protein